MLHHAVKARNFRAIEYIHKFYINRVNIDVNAWQKYMLIRDVKGRSVYDNAPDKEFENWLVRFCTYTTANHTEEFIYWLAN